MIPITHMPQQTFDKQAAIVVQKRESRAIKFPVPTKKSVTEQAEKTKKKAAVKRRRKEREEFFNTNQDIKSERKKKKVRTSELSD
jgi:formylmethanofuran dehydrogenase subunit E